MNKEKEIIEKAVSIPPENWKLIKKEGCYDRYTTEINGLELNLRQVSDGCPRHLEVMGQIFFDKDLLIPYVHKILEVLQNKQVIENEAKLNEIYKKLVNPK